MVTENINALCLLTRVGRLTIYQSFTGTISREVLDFRLIA